jgi:endonuclease YncB( thermonuclease family)
MGICVSSEYPTLSKNDYTILSNSTYENTPEYKLKNIQTYAKVVKIYDGDTVHLAIIVNGEKRRICCRLAHIDTAEMKSKNLEEKLFAVAAKNRLIDLVNNKLVYVNIIDTGKFGRYLGEIYKSKEDYEKENKSFNQILLDEGFAYLYEGGKKMEFNEWRKLK